ncbi:hypothetical protein N9850_14290, partial [Granulosicoccus sp.]
MKMSIVVKMFRSTLSLSLCVALLACGDIPTPSHPVIAEEFITQLNFNTKYDAVLVKSKTLQEDYIVVHDQALDTYDAYFIAGYQRGNNIDLHMELYEDKI